MTSLGNLQFVIHNSRSSKSTRRRLGACFLLAVQHVNSNDGAWGLSCEYPQDLRVPGWEVLRECRAVSHRSAGDLSAWVDSLTGKPTGPPGLRAWCNDTTIREANRTGSRSPPVTTMAGMLTEQLAANREQLELLERGPGTPTRRYDVAVTRCNSTPGGRDGLNDYSTSSRSALCRSSEIGLHGGSLSLPSRWRPRAPAAAWTASGIALDLCVGPASLPWACTRSACREAPILTGMYQHGL